MLQLIKGYIRITIYKELFAFFFFLDFLFQTGENAEVTKGGLWLKSSGAMIRPLTPLTEPIRHLPLRLSLLVRLRRWLH